MATPLNSSHEHLLDAHLPQFDLTSASHTVVRATAEATRAALSRSQPLRSLLTGLEALGLGDRVDATLSGDAGNSRIAGLNWSFGAEARGMARIVWSMTVRPHAEESALVSVRVRAAGSDEEAAERLRHAWPLLGPLVESAIRRQVAAVKQAAEEAEDAWAWTDAAESRPQLRSVV